MTFDLQDLVEKVVTLRKAIELKLGYSPEISSTVLAEKLSVCKISMFDLLDL